MGQRPFLSFEKSENTTLRWPIPEPPIAQSHYPSPESTARSNDFFFEPGSAFLVSSIASSTRPTLEAPSAPPWDIRNTSISPGRLNLPRSPNLYHHACPTAHPAIPGCVSPLPRRPIRLSFPCGLNILPTAYGSSPSAPSHRPLCSIHAAPEGFRLGP